MTAAIRLSLAGAVALGAALIAWSAGGDPSEYEERRSAIAAMSETQRQQLQRKYEDYRRMSEAERSAVLEIHEAGLGDESLRSTLFAYERFVSGLDPWEQMELRQLGPEERITRVQELIARRAPRDRRPPWMITRSMEGFVIPRRDLDEAMSLVAERAELPADADERLADLPAHLRHLEIARHVEQKARGTANGPRGSRPNWVWPDDPTARDLLQYLPESKFREFVLADERGHEFRRAAALSVLMRSLYAEWQDEVARIPRGEIEAALKGLSEKRHVDAARRDPGAVIRRVMEDLGERPGDTGEFAKKFNEVVRLWREFDPFGYHGVRGPSFLGAPFEGRPSFGPGRPGGDRGRGSDDDRRPGGPRGDGRDGVEESSRRGDGDPQDESRHREDRR